LKNIWVFVAGAIFIAIIVFAIVGYSAVAKKSNGSVAGSATPIPAGQNKEFFDQNAKVMFFYSDLCHWCQKEETDVLPDLGKAGYRLKPMDVGANPDLWQQYKIEGTPTFIAANGDKLVGFQDKDTLQKWLDAHK
jgi:hypothetical protein